MKLAKKVGVFLSVCSKENIVNSSSYFSPGGWHLCLLLWEALWLLWVRQYGRSDDASFQPLASRKGQLLLVLKHFLRVLSYCVRSQKTQDGHAGVVTCRHFIHQSHLSPALQSPPSKHQKKVRKTILDPPIKAIHQLIAPEGPQLIKWSRKTIQLSLVGILDPKIESYSTMVIVLNHSILGYPKQMGSCWRHVREFRLVN